ncbi:hypothetical protein SAMN04488026_100467 [Aliiruegeria lutimaris]|uniref:Uncharacterized protein n=1 Tax=Aliiruegeria lutimaris TaxID=571298 RepID=A0A1G8LL42_9RHOB|nr:hypothetical protein SAMN04488026_100467 [Aliiruegeria lutimaris]
MVRFEAGQNPKGLIVASTRYRNSLMLFFDTLEAPFSRGRCKERMPVKSPSDLEKSKTHTAVDQRMFARLDILKILHISLTQCLYVKKEFPLT